MLRRLGFVLAAALAIMVQPVRAEPPSTADWSSAQDLEIDLSSFAFSPKTVMLAAGVPYRLHFVDKASGGHDFTAAAFFRDAIIDPDDKAAVQGGAVRLAANQTADIRLIAPKAGTYEAHCSHFMHAVFGMRGQIVVQ